MPLSAARVLLHPPKRYVLSFDGEDDYVRMADSPSLDIVDEITVEALVYPMAYVGTGTRGTIVSKDGWSNGYLMWIQSNGRIQFGTRLTEGYGVTSNSTIELNKWSHLVGVYDGTSYRIYINASLDNTATQLADFGPNDWALDIGKYSPTSNHYLYGSIAYARIYNRALSASEVQHNYLNPMSPITNGLVLWFKMEEGSGTTVHDYSGCGNDGTIYGATWIEITHDPVRTLSPYRILSNVR